MKENHYCYFDTFRIELSAENADGKITDIVINKSVSKKIVYNNKKYRSY